jgi:hypothetical protein
MVCHKTITASWAKAEADFAKVKVAELRCIAASGTTLAWNGSKALDSDGIDFLKVREGV